MRKQTGIITVVIVAIAIIITIVIFVMVNKKGNNPSYESSIGTCSNQTPSCPIIINGDFEDGTTTGWYPFGPTTLTMEESTTNVYQGQFSVKVSDRTSGDWNGIAQNLLGKMENGVMYRISCWSKLFNTVSDNNNFKLTIKQIDDSGTKYKNSAVRANSNTWVEYVHFFTLTVNGTLSGLTLYAEGPAPGVGFYLDDVQIIPMVGDWKDNANKQIEQNRKRDIDITVLDSNFQPLKGASVDIQQHRRLFGFGTAISAHLNTNINYQNFFKNNFEWAVPENEAKWRYTEPQQGQLQYDDMDEMYTFCQAKNIQVRGHSVVWAVEKRVQSWVQALNNTELQQALENRFDSLVNRYKAKFKHWDVNNEMLHGSFYQDRLGQSIRPWMFNQVKTIDPNCLTFVNDFNIITWSPGEVTDYVGQIQSLISAGATIDGIGVQGHFTSSVNHYTTKEQLDTLAKEFPNLPIWITEYDCEQPDDKLRAEALETLYRTAFAHPAVHGILMWGFWAGAHWKGSKGAIVNTDWTVNAAGQMYQSLMNEWKTNDTKTTDLFGQTNFRGFHGTYNITVTPATGGLPQVFELVLNPGEGIKIFTVTYNS